MALPQQVWRDFRDFWKAQVIWAVIVAAVTLAWQYHRRQFSGSIRENVWALLIPYLSILGIFVVLNITRTVFISERDAVRVRRREVRRAEHRAERERNAPKQPNPNLKFRRVYTADRFLQYQNRSQAAYWVEVGNELLDGAAVGHALNVRAHVSYLDTSSGEVLHLECPGYWRSGNHECVNILVGEGQSFAVSFCSERNSSWVTPVANGISMRGDFIIQTRILAPDGKCLSDVISVRFRWNGKLESAPTLSTI